MIQIQSIGIACDKQFQNPGIEIHFVIWFISNSNIDFPNIPDNILMDDENERATEIETNIKVRGKNGDLKSINITS